MLNRGVSTAEHPDPQNEPPTRYPAPYIQKPHKMKISGRHTEVTVHIYNIQCKNH